MCMEAVTGETPALGMPCGHVFHRACAGTWLANNDTCPTCRFQLGAPGTCVVVGQFGVNNLTSGGSRYQLVGSMGNSMLRLDP